VSVIGQDGQSRTLFVKSNDACFLDNFQCEWEGLTRLGESETIGVPQPIAVGVVSDQAYLVTEWIEQTRQSADFFIDFGRALADLHRATIGTRIGLDRDNHLGAAPQMNTARIDSAILSWPEFFALQRIEYQIRWAVDQGLADGQLQRNCQRIADNMDQILDGRDEATSLLHGDLWSGNYLAGPDGQPFIIDPAIYYGCREAEFGMLRLFGSCPDSFYAAYTDRFPLPSGWQRRVGVYVLYHLLNHLNLFGSGYHSQCRQVAAEILASH
jgi:fructosamine-3-kinase